MRFHQGNWASMSFEVTAVLLALAIGLGPPWLKGLLIPVDQAGQHRMTPKGLETPEILDVSTIFEPFRAPKPRLFLDFPHVFRCFSMIYLIYLMTLTFRFRFRCPTITIPSVGALRLPLLRQRRGQEPGQRLRALADDLPGRSDAERGGRQRPLGQQGLQRPEPLQAAAHLGGCRGGQERPKRARKV